MQKFTRLNTENGIAFIKLVSDHFTVRAVTLRTFTDKIDTLVEQSVRHVYGGRLEQMSGSIFIFDDIVNEKSSVYIVPAPDCVLPTVSAKDGTVSINAFGYDVYTAEAELGEGERLCREWYRSVYKSHGLHAMSNTWGDRNGRTRVRDEFVRREIESGADLGLDVVQIDDGWQKGVPDVFDDEGRRIFDGDFWELRTDIFPNGMKALSDYAHSLGVELGLWFAPHSRDGFAHFERDLGVLRTAHDEWNMRYFKLDMIQLYTPALCERMREFLDGVLALGDGVSVELDVTADQRLGYLMSAPYGTIFVENRYTAWSNYYPHRTLKNLWSLSRFVPTSKLQMELVNPDLFTDKYSDADPLRPQLYGVDYTFASVMLSNPLFWMETQFLSDENRAKLKKMLNLWHAYRDELVSSDVYPIGEEPSGRALSGFVAEGDEWVHLVLFRENTRRSTFTFDAGVELDEIELVASNTSAQVSAEGTSVSVEFAHERSFVWIRAKKK